MSNTTFSGPVRSEGGFQTITKNATTGAITVVGSIGTAIVSGVQSLSGAGAVDVINGVTSLTTTGAAQALTLANGTVGQMKTVIHTVDGGSAVLTPTTKIGFSTITFTNVGESANLIYTSAGWAIASLNGAVAA